MGRSDAHPVLHEVVGGHAIAIVGNDELTSPNSMRHTVASASKASSPVPQRNRRAAD